jgi:TPR repeat protein
MRKRIRQIVFRGLSVWSVKANCNKVVPLALCDANQEWKKMKSVNSENRTHFMEELNTKNYETADIAFQSINRLEQRFKLGDPFAGYALAFVYSEGSTFVPSDVKKAIVVSEEKSLIYMRDSFPLLEKEAAKGNAEAMYLIGSYYQTGTAPVQRNKEFFRSWNQKAFDAGYLGAVDNLLAIYGDRKSEFYNPEYAEDLYSKYVKDSQ